MVSVGSRLAVYKPDGVLRGYLKTPASWSASFPFNDISALQLTYPRAARDSVLLDGPCEIGIEIGTPGGWIEPRGGRYRLVEASANVAQGKADMVDYVCPGYGSLLDGIVVVPVKYGDPDRFDDSGRREFLAASPGDILATVRAEAAKIVDRLAPGLEFTFTTDKDSFGKPWTKAVTIAFEPGLGLGQILQNLTDQGQCDWWMDGRKLFVVNPDSGQDRKIRVDAGAGEYPIRSTIAGLIHAGFLVGEENTWRVDNPGVPAPWGNSMRVLTQGGVKDEATARQLVQAELDKGAQERVEYQWSGNLGGVDFVPFQDFLPGDRVQARNKKGKFEPMRVTEITLSFNDGGLTCGLMFNDRFLDAQVRAARRLKGITRGASGDAGTGTTPDRGWGARPYPVEGLVASSSGYWEENGQAAGKVDLSWAPVTRDERGIKVDVERYRVNVDGKIVETDSTTATVSGLLPGRTVPIEVVAIDRNGVVSAPVKATVEVSFPEDMLDPPTRLKIDQSTGLVEVSWDGMLVSSAGVSYVPPKHFDHVVIQEQLGSVSDTEWRDVTTLDGAGTVTLSRKGMQDSTLYYRAFAVDVVGSRSQNGEIASARGEESLPDRLDDARRKLAEAEENFQGLLTELGSDSYVDHLYHELIQARLLAAEKIITKEMLADGAVTARTLNVVAPENSSGLSLDPGGMTVISQHGEYSSAASFRADSPNFIQFVKGDQTTFLATPEGTLAAENINAAQTLTVGGKNVVELIEENSGGALIGYARMDQSGSVTVYGAQPPMRVAQLTLTMPEKDRALKVVFTTDASLGTNTRVDLRWAKRSYTDSNDPSVFDGFSPTAQNDYFLTRSMSAVFPSMREAFPGVAPGENFTIGAFIWVISSSNAVKLWSTTTLAAFDGGQPVQLQLSKPYAPAGGGKPQVGHLTDRPLQTFKKTFPATWYRIYNSASSPVGDVNYAFEDGTIRDGSTGYMNRLVVGLDSDSIQAFTSGALFKSVYVFAEGGGGQYQLGPTSTRARWNVHNYSTPPATYHPLTSPVYEGPWSPTTVNRVRWGALFAGLKAGSIKGLSLQPTMKSGGLYSSSIRFTRVWAEVTIQK